MLLAFKIERKFDEISYQIDISCGQRHNKTNQRHFDDGMYGGDEVEWSEGKSSSCFPSEMD